MSIDNIANGSLKLNASQIAEQTPKREILELFKFNSNSVNVNLPPAFTEALKITAADEVTAELITTAAGPGILILPKRQGTI